ncbi:hypothetical protein ANRL2_02703 [Anaerolineae bacterium]|nr:hypothetical protein ANRL2_02703 [Anaerolineae bacterium]
MKEQPREKKKRWYDSWLAPLGNALIEVVLLGLAAAGSVLAAWMFGIEQRSNRAHVLGMALAMLFLIVVLVAAAVVWAYRMQNTKSKSPQTKT